MQALDLGKPKSTRTFVVCVKSQRSYNLKNFSLYQDTLNLVELIKICKLMLLDERDIYLDLEKRYIFEDIIVKAHTHTIQIYQFDGNKAIGSKSFGIKELAYSANEIANCLEIWFKKKLRNDNNLKFTQGKVYEILEKCLK